MDGLISKYLLLPPNPSVLIFADKLYSRGLVVRENIGRNTYSVVLKFFVERTDFTKSLMSKKKQLNVIVNNKQRN